MVPCDHCKRLFPAEDLAFHPESGETKCDACAETEVAYWRRYFGLDQCKTKAERRAQIEAFAPVGGES